MKKVISDRSNAIIVGIIIIAYFNSCNGQSQKNDGCILHLKNARRNLNNFYQNNQQSLLTIALNEAENSMQCDNTKRGAIELKLTVFMLLKKYDAGYKYLDSVSEKDFKFTYQKKMWDNYFRALEFESKTDTFNKDKLLNNTVLSIQNYIRQDSLSKDKLNEEFYFDLFTIKKLFLPPYQINKELDSLGERYPKEKDFFIALKKSSSAEAKPVEPSKN